jgi:DNA replication ATP-dependent helicase Dna2
MSSGIMELSNSLIYGSRLSCGSLEIANAKLKFSGKEPVHSKLKEVLPPSFCLYLLAFNLELCCQARFSRLLTFVSNFFWLQILNPDRAVIFVNTGLSLAQIAMSFWIFYHLRLTIWPKFADQIPALEAKEHQAGNNPIEAHIVSWVRSDLCLVGWTKFHASIYSSANVLLFGWCLLHLLCAMFNMPGSLNLFYSTT